MTGVSYTEKCKCGGVRTVTDHGTYEEFYCPKCKCSGSRSTKRARRHYK
jgi:hypothetical protein